MSLRTIGYANKGTRKGHKMNRTEIQEIVTNNIISALDAGVVPWQKPWDGYGGQTSLSTGKAYRGVNTLILDAVQMSHGYGLPLWGTYKQIAALGGQIRKGEKGTPIVFWKKLEKESDDGEKSSFMMMKFYTVFNVDQADGVEIPARFLVEREPVDVLEGVGEALSYGPVVRHVAQDKAYYEAGTDRITLPALEQFASPEKYAATALHEVAHSTGHESRLARLDSSAPFGCASYAEEELVAEIAAAMLATVIGVRVEWDQTAAYVASWLRVLRNDRAMIVSAAQKAQKAVDVVLAASMVQEVAA